MPKAKDGGREQLPLSLTFGEPAPLTRGAEGVLRTPFCKHHLPAAFFSQSLLPADLGASPRILLAVVGHDPFTNRRKKALCCPEMDNKGENF